jgi:hypothetical protein
MKTKDCLFYLGIFIYVFFFIYYYPQFFSIADEGSYLTQTYHLLKGEIIVTDDFDSVTYTPARIPNLSAPVDDFFAQYALGKYIPGYPFGNSVLFLPFVPFGWKSIFLVGLMFHLLNFLLITNILKKYDLDRVYALLYLLYPGLVFYSRTIMSEVPTITFTLLGFYFILSGKKRSYLLAGLMLGISCLFRTTNALVIIGMGIPLMYSAIKKTFTEKFANEDVKKIFLFGLGVLPSFILTLLFNWIAYGGFFNTRYLGGGTKIFGYFLTFASIQAYLQPIIILLVSYPLLLLPVFLMKYKKRFELCAMTLLFLAVMSRTDTMRYDLITNLVIGSRYFLVIIPFLLIPYSLALDKYLKQFVPYILLVLMIAAPILMFTQNKFTDNKALSSERIYSVIPESALIVVNGDPQYINAYFGKNPAIMFYQFAKLDYLGEYYLVEFRNPEILSSIDREAEFTELQERRRPFEEYLIEHKPSLIYENRGLIIYRGYNQ